MTERPFNPSTLNAETAAELAELYAVGATTPEESAELERLALIGDPIVTRELARVRPVIEALARSVPAEQVSTKTRSALESAIQKRLESSHAALRLSDPIEGINHEAVDSTRLVVVRLGSREAVGNRVVGARALVVLAGILVVKDRVLVSGEQAEEPETFPDASSGPDGAALLAVYPDNAARTARGFASGSRVYGGWLAAAAATAIAAVGWMRPVQGTGPLLGSPEDVAMLAAAEGTRIIPMMAQGNIANLGKIGEFVWNQRLQRGYLRLRQLDPNDPQIAQYQGWFFDSTRDAKYPVSAGIFDVASASSRDTDGNLLIPIKPDLPVRDLDLFAVTVEKSGGVVVTDKSGLVLLAQADG